MPSRFVAKAGLFKNFEPATIKGGKLIELRNSPRAKWLANRYTDSEITLVNKETDIYMELAAGRGDIGFGSSVVSSEAFLKKPEGKGHEQVGQTVRLDAGGGVGIAVRKGEDSLRDKVNGALKAIRADGTYKKMAAQCFDVDISGAQRQPPPSPLRARPLDGAPRRRGNGPARSGVARCCTASAPRSSAASRSRSACPRCR